MSEGRAIPGMHDVLPKQHDYFTFIKKVVRYHARRTGLKRISLPGLVPLDILEKAYGPSSTIFTKGLFRVEKDGQAYAMRPSSTVSIARAYIEHQMSEQLQPVELYYIDQMWQSIGEGETLSNQDHVAGFDILGEEDPALDAQLIQMSLNTFSDLGITARVKINNIGTPAVQEKFREDLRNFFVGKERSLHEDDVAKLEDDPMLLLASKHEDTKILASLAPKIDSVLDKESKEHYEKLKEYLEILGISYEEDPTLFFDASMSTHAVFQFEADVEARTITEVVDEEEVTTEIPAKTVLLGNGGRYNTLVENLGGEPTPAVGCYFSMEKAAEIMTDIHLKVPSKDSIDVFCIQLGDDAKRESLKLVSDLRRKGIKTLGALGKASIRDQLDKARQFEVRYSLVMGQMEVREKKIIIRDMEKGTQEIIPFDGIVDRMVELLGTSSLDTQDFKSMIEEVSDID